MFYRCLSICSQGGGGGGSAFKGGGMPPRGLPLAGVSTSKRGACSSGMVTEKLEKHI